MNILWENPGMIEIFVIGGLDLKLSKVLSSLRCSDSIMVLCRWHYPLKMNHALGQTENTSSKIPREVKLCALISPICSFHNSHISSLAIPHPPMILSTSETYTVGLLVREVFPPDICMAPPQRGLPSKMAPSPLLSYPTLLFSSHLFLSSQNISSMEHKMLSYSSLDPVGMFGAKMPRQNYAFCV